MMDGTVHTKSHSNQAGFCLSTWWICMGTQFSPLGGFLLKWSDFAEQILCDILFALNLCLPRPLTCFFFLFLAIMNCKYSLFSHKMHAHAARIKNSGILLLHYTSGHVLQQKWDCAHGKQIINDEWGKRILIVSDLKAIIDLLYSNPFICSWECRHPLFPFLWKWQKWQSLSSGSP